MRVWHRLYISLEEKKPLRQLILSPKLINSLIALMLNTTIRVSTAGRHFFNHTGVLLIFALRYIATHTVSNHYNHACILHIQFLQKEFLPYLEMWKKSVEGRGGYSDGEKERMMLSQKTLTGIQITGMKNPTSHYSSATVYIYIYMQLYTFMLSCLLQSSRSLSLFLLCYSYQGCHSFSVTNLTRTHWRNFLVASGSMEGLIITLPFMKHSNQHKHSGLSIRSELTPSRETAVVVKDQCPLMIWI